MKPLVGITADYKESGEFSSRIAGEGRYVLREGYVQAVAEAGGEPIILPYGKNAESLVARIDGLLITGGDFDIPPALSGIRDPASARKIRPQRTQYELDLLKNALERDMPVLGICGGMQLMAVALGGKLIGDIVAEVPGGLNHEQEAPRDQAGHAAIIVKGTLLHKLTGVTTLGVNSSHHQAVAHPGEAIVCATAPDGVIEAIELRGKKFALGVEWHPEIMTSNKPHLAILRGFIKACESP